MKSRNFTFILMVFTLLIAQSYSSMASISVEKSSTISNQELQQSHKNMHTHSMHSADEITHHKCCEQPIEPKTLCSTSQSNNCDEMSNNHCKHQPSAINLYLESTIDHNLVMSQTNTFDSLTQKPTLNQSNLLRPPKHA